MALIDSIEISEWEKRFDKILNNNAIVLSFLTILAIASVNFYEWGYCYYFDIPRELIEIELSRYSYLIFFFIGTVFMVFFVGSLAYVILEKIEQKWKNKFTSNLKINILVALFIGIISIQGLGDGLEVMSLASTLILSAFLLLNSLIYSKDTGRSFNTLSLSFRIGVLMITAVLICLLCFFVGIFNAGSQKTFYIRNDNKTIFLRKYGSIYIYGEKKVDKSGKYQINFHHFELNNSKNDSLTKIYLINF